MRKHLLLLASLLLAAPLAAQRDVPPEEILQAYVAKPDDSYAWHVQARFERRGAEVVELRLHSQTWQDVLWKHRLFLIKPANLSERAHQGMLMIAGGRWQEEFDEQVPEELPDGADRFLQIAEQLGSVMAVLAHVPFQPLYGKTEDRLIAHTFEQYLATGDHEWPLLLPMVKSAVKAMDAMQEYAREDDWNLELQSFTVMGGSKRGWTTWLTAAVDQRVTGIVPMVIDVLNFVEHIPHQTAKWGRPSDSIAPYTELGLDHVLVSETGEELRRIVDPYYYLPKIDQPKLIVIGTNDPYFPLDSLNLYWHAVQEPRYVLYLPNDTHSLRDFRRLLPSLARLHHQAATGEAMPELDWEYHEDGAGLRLCMRSDVDPRRVRIWMAESDDLDFRDATWTSRRPQRRGGTYQFTLREPSARYVAVFGEAAFGSGSPYYLSTGVKILGPDVPGRPPHSDEGVCARTSR